MIELKRIFWLVAFICASQFSFAQWDYGFELGVIPVVLDGDTMPNPWTGGLTAPQWSPIDLDFDGDEDLFGFDRDGHRILTFERDGEDWIYRPEWSKGWPELDSWCLLRDFDCDGKPDVFTAWINGISVYKNNTTNPLNPQFDLVASPLECLYDDGSGPDLVPVVCLSSDIPAIQDLDDDGDLDIITFTAASATLFKYEGLNDCELEMECTNRCYGMLSEASENNNLYIGEDFNCEFNVVDPREEQRHIGGSLTALQLDDNGPLDLLIGDVTYPTIIGVLLEDAVDGQDSAIFTDFDFPSQTNGIETLDCQRFPAAYHIDVDADGVRDLLFSPNTYLEVDDDNSVYYMRNTGTEDQPVWDNIIPQFLQDGMIDMGRGCYPLLVDLDGDNLLDLVVTNKENYIEVGSTPAKLRAYKNTGTISDPVFTMPVGIIADLATFGIESPVPAIGDVDGDGDVDLIIGDELGILHYYENINGAGNWPEFELSILAMTDDNGERIDIGQFAAPQLIDINYDGLLDLVVGEKNGTLNLFLNCGTSTQMSWCQYISDEFGQVWGNILVDNALGINGYSTPSLTTDESGTHILVSNEVGTVQYFGLLQEDLNFEYTEQTTNVLNYVSGYRSKCTFGELNDDGKIDCLMGIQNGGMRCYIGSDSVTINAPELPITDKPKFNLFPNPGESVLNWICNDPQVEVQIFNSTGILMGTSKERQVQTSNWPAGTYIVVPTKTGSPFGPPALWIKLED